MNMKRIYCILAGAVLVAPVILSASQNLKVSTGNVICEATAVHSKMTAEYKAPSTCLEAWESDFTCHLTQSPERTFSVPEGFSKCVLGDNLEAAPTPINGILYRRVLLDGTHNREDVVIAANGRIDISIAGNAGTGYEWELERPPVSHTVTLLGEPEFIPNTPGLPGSAGQTLFKFQVDPNPNRGFTLYFQLKRPWETEPIKQFYVRFIATPTE